MAAGPTAREPGGHERMAMRNYMPAHWQLCACAGIHRRACANAHETHSMCNCIPELLCASCRRVPAQTPQGTCSVGLWQGKNAAG